MAESNRIDWRELARLQRQNPIPKNWRSSWIRLLEPWTSAEKEPCRGNPTRATSPELRRSSAPLRNLQEKPTPHVSFRQLAGVVAFPHCPYRARLDPSVPG
jgi:hypothetical protein